ncbi:hypothetical protein ADICEAN_03532 [Cesiribacter andamanensis AMV16]|uniref:DUF418 domain-containing protein n=2 Tax=Cesiribacter TaxID=1133570 RepID=M7N220_9BACT|nr:hypothetical protein ADICEAN_03532 [Cesiribacter andamanensis AMV16]
MTVRYNVDLYRDKAVVQKGVPLAAIDTLQQPLTALQKKDLAAYTALLESSSLEARQKKARETIENVTGSYASLYRDRTGRYENALVNYLYLGLWDVLLFMFLGMAFYKLGIITGHAPQKVYWYLLLGGLGLGLILSYLRLQSMIYYNFNYITFLKEGSFSYYELGRAARALGIFGGIMLLWKSGLARGFFALMKPVGQMAFTNYLMQSLLCGVVFYGIGFGLYGRLERWEIYGVMGAVWLFQILYSNIWMRYYRFGPMEWLWRSLTYWQRQPFRRDVQLPVESRPAAV